MIESIATHLIFQQTTSNSSGSGGGGGGEGSGGGSGSSGGSSGGSGVGGPKLSKAAAARRAASRNRTTNVTPGSAGGLALGLAGKARLHRRHSASLNNLSIQSRCHQRVGDFAAGVRCQREGVDLMAAVYVEKSEERDEANE